MGGRVEGGKQRGGREAGGGWEAGWRMGPPMMGRKEDSHGPRLGEHITVDVQHQVSSR